MQSVLGEKFRTADAIAYYFALTEAAKETSFGIVRFKKHKGKTFEKGISSQQAFSYAHATWRGAFLFVGRGSSFLGSPLW